jgi:hypothetical protein
MSLILDNPDITTTKDQLAKLVLHRVKMRYHFPTKFKSKELAEAQRRSSSESLLLEIFTE